MLGADQLTIDAVLYWTLHCLKYNLNLCIKTKAVTDRQYVWFLHTVYLAQKPDIYRCISSNRDKLGFMQRFRFSWNSVDKSSTVIYLDIINKLKKIKKLGYCIIPEGNNAGSSYMYLKSFQLILQFFKQIIFLGVPGAFCNTLVNTFYFTNYLN